MFVNREPTSEIFTLVLKRIVKLKPLEGVHEENNKENKKRIVLLDVANFCMMTYFL